MESSLRTDILVKYFMNIIQFIQQLQVGENRQRALWIVLPNQTHGEHKHFTKVPSKTKPMRSGY